MSERGPATGSKQVNELKVSGHTMALEPGLYCVFNAPDAPAVSAATGLPGVRITAAPVRRGGSVEVVGFGSDGWIGQDAAALVRVTGGAAEVMVTVYQEPGSTAESPKLQVVRLAGEASPGPQAEQPGGQQAGQQAGGRVRAAPEDVEVVAHVYARGDLGGKLGTWMGEPGSNRWIEGFAISPVAGVPPSDIEYQAVLGRGWLSPWSEGGQFCGSRGMSLPILGLRVKLRGASAETHRAVLSASFVDGTRVGPVGDGEACEAPSLAALEAFQVSLVPREEKAAAQPAKQSGRGKAAGAARAAEPARKPVQAAKPAKAAGRAKVTAPPAPPPQAPAGKRRR